MSLNVAYTSEFGDPDGSLWRVDIMRNYNGNPTEIGLDAEQPIIIEWSDTELQDAIAASKCTLKVVNDKDRQMIQLMQDDYAVCKVYRDNKLYWTGVLDKGVYEEPYSYADSYITEITFSDFGALNRFAFPEYSGPLSLYAIVALCLVNISIDPATLQQSVSLRTPGGNPVVLEHIYVDGARFKDMTLREVLEEILRPFSYRIVQRKGKVLVYDIDWCYDNSPVIPVAWKGVDAALSSCGGYGKFELSFDHQSEPVIADGSIDAGIEGFTVSTNYYPIYSDDFNAWDACFYIDGIDHGFTGKLPDVDINNNECRPVRFARGLTGENEVCFARRILCYSSNRHEETNLLLADTPMEISGMTELFSMDSGYIPVLTDRTGYQLRVNLDMILSPFRDPFDQDSQSPLEDYELKAWKAMRMSFVPIKLELLDNEGRIIKHFVNVTLGSYNYIYPNNPYGEWVDGPGSPGEAVLSFYEKKDEHPFGHGWKTNKQTYDYNSGQLDAPAFFKKIEDGEYVPLPPAAGCIRLTVYNGIQCSYTNKYNSTLIKNWSEFINKTIRWQLYRNPTITLVKAKTVANGIDNVKIT